MTPPNPRKPERSIRQRLLEARSDVLRQIETLGAAPTGPGELDHFHSRASRLRETLRRIEEALAESDEAQGPKTPDPPSR
jgi:hypothetical protein